MGRAPDGENLRAGGQSMAERGSPDRLRKRPPRAIWTERFARCDGDRRRDAGADEPAAERGEQDAFELSQQVRRRIRPEEVERKADELDGMPDVAGGSSPGTLTSKSVAGS